MLELQKVIQGWEWGQGRKRTMPLYYARTRGVEGGGGFFFFEATGDRYDVN